MPHSQRLLLCRAGFVLFCLLPTLVVAGWIARRSSAGYRAAQREEWQQALSERLGLAVEIADLAYPSVDAAVLSGVRLSDPETDAVIAEAAFVEVTRSADGWRVEAAQPVVFSAALADVAAGLHDRLLRCSAAEMSPVEISAREATLAAGTVRQTITNVRCRLESAASGPAATIAFHVPGAERPSSEPVRLSIARHRDSQPAATWLQLDTGTSSVPLALAADLVPELAALGQECRFAGRLTASRWGGGWTGQLSGMLDDVDLDRLVSERFGHQLSGLATISVQRATLDRGRLIELRGTIRAEDAAISPSLIAAAQEHLALVRAADNATLRTAALVPISRLAIRCELDERSLVLRPADRDSAGPLLVNDAGPILEAPPGHKTAVVNLLRVLLPDNYYQVPATRQTESLVRLLPVPDLVPPPASATTSSHTPTRLAPASSADRTGVRQPAVR